MQHCNIIQRMMNCTWTLRTAAVISFFCSVYICYNKISTNHKYPTYNNPGNITSINNYSSTVALTGGSIPWHKKDEMINGSLPNILDLQRPPYSPNYKNPCWKEKTDHGERLRCLPYFLIAGMPKSGTTELWHYLCTHPMIRCRNKEPNFWDRRQHSRKLLLEEYVKIFDEYVERIEKRVEFEKGEPYHPVITGEASHSNLWANFQWQKFPGNSITSPEPTILNIHFIHHIVPQIKVILIMRDPVERLYSGYLYHGRAQYRNTTQFHEQCIKSIHAWNMCTKKHTPRYCVYTKIKNISWMNAKVFFQLNMYAVFVKDLLNVFPRRQLLFIKFEEFLKNEESMLKDVYRFLELGPIKESIKISAPRNARRPHLKLLGPMLNKTRLMLKEFLRPYNEELSQVLNDKKFLFDD